MKLTRTRSCSSLFSAVTALVLIGLSGASSAAPVPYPVVITDTSGSRVTGATFAINGTTLTPGTAATVTGKLLATGATVSSASVTEYELSSGAYVVLYDASATGEAYFPLTVTKSGSVIQSVYDLVCSGDSTNIVSAGTTATAINTKLGTPAGASISADIATANANLVTNFTTLLGRIAQTVQFDGSGYVKANAQVLPAAPAGYGGGGTPSVHR